MKEFKEDKIKLEEEIVELINKFEEKYECHIYEINLIHDAFRDQFTGLHAKTLKANINFIID